MTVDSLVGEFLREVIQKSVAKETGELRWNGWTPTVSKYGSLSQAGFLTIHLGHWSQANKKEYITSNIQEVPVGGFEVHKTS